MQENGLTRWRKEVEGANMRQLYRSHGKVLAYTIRPNRNVRSGAAQSADTFQDAAAPLGAIHHLYGNFGEVPCGKGKLRETFVCRLSNAVAGEYGVSIGGRHEGNRLALDLGKKPGSGGGAFPAESNLLNVFIDMFIAVRDGSHTAKEDLNLSSLLGTDAAGTARDRLYHAAENPEAWGLFPAAYPGRVELLEADGACVIRTTPLVRGLDELVDDIPVIPGTVPAVSAGQVITRDDALLRVDAESLATISEAELEPLNFFVQEAVTAGRAPEVFAPAQVIVNGVSLYGTAKGKLYEDIRYLCDGEGRAILQLVNWQKRARPVFDSPDKSVRLNAGRTAFHWKFHKNFVALSPYEEQKQVQKRLKRLGPKRALEILCKQAFELPDSEYENKIPHLVASWPFEQVLPDLKELMLLTVTMGKFSVLDVPSRVREIHNALEALTYEEPVADKPAE
jgi:hypothetical protein